jgi:hypothetical protein
MILWWVLLAFCVYFSRRQTRQFFGVYVILFTHGWKVEKESYTIDENLKN